jgi:hypothetical protein
MESAIVLILILRGMGSFEFRFNLLCEVTDRDVRVMPVKKLNFFTIAGEKI